MQYTTIVWTHPTVLINSHIPIDEGRLLLRFAVLMKKPEGVEVPRSAIQVHIDAMSEGYLQDVAIWENKRWQDQPIRTATAPLAPSAAGTPPSLISAQRTRQRPARRSLSAHDQHDASDHRVFTQ